MIFYLLLPIFLHLYPMAGASGCGNAPAARGYTCYQGYCGADGPLPHHPVPQCGPQLAELHLGGSSVAERVELARAWCDNNRILSLARSGSISSSIRGGDGDTNVSGCHGFAIDANFGVTLAFSSTNFTAASQPNSQWNAYWLGPPQPLPPTPPPRPSPTPPPSPPWSPILPRGPCLRDEDCSLNGICNKTHGDCVCRAGWRGHNCQQLALAPQPRIPAYGGAPNITSWGGSILRETDDTAVDDTIITQTSTTATSTRTTFSSSSSSSASSAANAAPAPASAAVYHLYVTEETDGKGLASWETNSQIVHAVADTPTGPYRRLDLVAAPSHSNPQILRAPPPPASNGNNSSNATSMTLLLFHIAGGGSFRLMTASSYNGPWIPQHFPVGTCNNPTAAFARNGSLYLVCHNGGFEMYALDPAPGRPAYLSPNARGPMPLFPGGQHPNAPGNCEDPFLFFDRNGYFHVIAHCYTCYWYPSNGFTLDGRYRGPCSSNASCSGHGFSRTGEPGTWTWIGGEDAPYNFTERTSEPSTTVSFSTRERPWALLGGPEGDEVVVLINGVSPAFPQLKFVSGRDWTYTNIQATTTDAT